MISEFKFTGGGGGGVGILENISISSALDSTFSNSRSDTS